MRPCNLGLSVVLIIFDRQVYTALILARKRMAGDLKRDAFHDLCANANNVDGGDQKYFFLCISRQSRLRQAKSLEM